MTNARWLLVLLAWIAGNHAFADPLFPDLPQRNLPVIRTLPKQGEIVLEVRSGVLSGDEVTESGKTLQGTFITDRTVQIGVLNISDGSEAIWRLSDDIPLRFSLTCNLCTMRAGWAPKPRKLFLALLAGAYLIDISGGFTKLNLKVPGVALTYKEANDFAISDDAQLVAFNVDGRDPGDTHSEVYFPNTAKMGRYYQGLVYEGTKDSIPVFAYPGSFHVTPKDQVYTMRADVPAWSPGHRSIAYSWEGEDAKGVSSSNLVVASTFETASAPISITLPSPWSAISNIRWAPDGKRIAFMATDARVYGDFKYRLFILNADGSALRKVQFGNLDINVTSFAWSPSGDRLVFRSDYQAKELCNTNLMYRIQAGSQPCRRSENLFVANANGSGLMKLSIGPEYRHAQLFWIQ
jgi:hypothetical protein